ncbi:MAG: glutaredoxin 3, partial [Pseudomonadota bacterium]
QPRRGVAVNVHIPIHLHPAEPERKLELTGRRTVAQICIGATHVGGCDELHELDRRGELMPLLQG